MKKMIKKPEKLVKRKYGMEKGFHFNRDCVKCNQSYKPKGKFQRLCDICLKKAYIARLEYKK